MNYRLLDKALDGQSFDKVQARRYLKSLKNKYGNQRFKDKSISDYLVNYTKPYTVRDAMKYTTRESIEVPTSWLWFVMVTLTIATVLTLILFTTNK